MTTPKQRFQVSGHSAKFQAIAASESFEVACDYAMLELQSLMFSNVTDLKLPTDPYIGIDANAQMHGAGRVIEILKHIHEPEKEKPTTKKDTLHYA